MQTKILDDLLEKMIITVRQVYRLAVQQLHRSIPDELEYEHIRNSLSGIFLCTQEKVFFRQLKKLYLDKTTAKRAE